MLPINNDTKLGRFWDFPIENVNEKTLEEVKQIINFREKLLIKVTNQEWTEEEYKHFISIIKLLRVRNFVEYIEVANAFIEMPQVECYKELINILNIKLLEPNPNIKSIPEMIAQAINIIQSKLLSITRIPITEEEQVKTRTLDEEIEYYKQLITEVRDKDSEYNKVFTEIFRNWVDNFATDSLKKALLVQESKLIDRKLSYLTLHYKTSCDRKERIKNSPINSHNKNIRKIEMKRSSHNR